MSTAFQQSPGPTTPVSGSVAVTNFPASQAVTSVDGGLVTVGNTADANTASTLVGILKRIRDTLLAGIGVTVANFPATQPVSGTVAVSNFPGTQAVSGTVNATPNRPTQGAGRVYFRASLAAQTTTQTARTVTAGKVYYVTSIILSAFNTSAAAVGQLEIREGATVLVPFVIPQAGAGAVDASPAMVAVCLTFQEPLQFAAATTVVVGVAAGTLTYSAAFIGYEE